MLFFIIFWLKVWVAFCAFKYISCYSLSIDLISGLANTNIFKYISCYSLSYHLRLCPLETLHLNTSHVILYPGRSPLHGQLPAFKYISCYSLSFLSPSCCWCSSHLNTSHVILYLSILLF